MADANAGTATSGKKKTEVTMVKMQDGREVGFAGKRKVQKETLIDTAAIQIDDKGIYIPAGAIQVRLDLRNGAVKQYPLPLPLIPKFAGHGGEQKYGDELASPSDKPLSEEDMEIALDDLNAQIQAGDWSAVREGGGGFAGASVVVLAIAEASGKSVEDVKKFLQGKLDAAKAAGEKLSRKDLYDSFRNPNSKTGKIIERMEKERLAKDAKVDADAALAEMEAA